MQQKKKSTIISEGMDRPKAHKNRHYVDNKKFYEALVQRQQKLKDQKQQGKPAPKIDNYIGECLLKIQEGLQKKYNFSRPQYAQFREEMVGDAIINCLTYIDNFDPEKTKNPFSYFTQTCYYQFLRRIEEEELAKVTKYKATIKSSTFGQLASSEEDDESLDNIDMTMENMEQLVTLYDEKMKVRKDKAKTRRQEKKRGLEIHMEEDDEQE